MVRSLQPRAAIIDAALGLAAMLLLTAALIAWRAWILDPRVVTLLAYLAVWIPLSAAVVVACLRHGSGSLIRDFGLRFRPIDLLWGVAIGLLARVLASLLEIISYGSTVPPPIRFAADYDAWWVFAVILAPVVIGPLVEEVFFRGLLLRAVLAQCRSSVLAVVVSGVVFAVAHAVQLPPGAGMLIAGVSTLVLGLAAGSVAVFTGRIGAAVVAHVTFNALGVVPGLF